ncbi:MAG TPA: hypothetical protein VK540_29980 [Polyangiaceae bacterium]|nr:hypothetical protein [Polyangiaceae bacterium]
MLAWSFSARTLDEVASLLRAMGRHRYVREADHAIHWSVDQALSDRPTFAARAAAFQARRAREAGLDVSSRDPSLWAYADTEVIIEALAVFWTKGDESAKATTRLREILEASELGLAAHPPFRTDPEEPPHPELILLDWVFFPIDELDAERHGGALRALELAGEEVDVSTPVYLESVCLSYPELARGAPQGVLPTDFLVWSDGAYSYVDYVFRGVAKAARLLDPPVGIRDLDE